MFFKKKSDLPDAEKDHIAKKGIKRMDAVVTGVILSGIVASLYGVKKLREHESKKEETIIHPPEEPVRKRGFFARIFGK